MLFCASLQAGLLAPNGRRIATPAAKASSVYERLLSASELVNSEGRVILSPEDRATALADMHLQPQRSGNADALYAWKESSPGKSERVRKEVDPSDFLPPDLFADTPVDVTELVTETMPKVLAAHPIFASMAEELMGNDKFYSSVYFGRETRDADSLEFPALCRRLIASIHLFESLIGQGHPVHRQLAQHYEWRYEAAARRSRARPPRLPSSPRYALMGFFLALKGESVLASINAFEMLRRLSPGDEAAGPSSAAVAALSRTLNDIMSLNIFEAIISNLSFAFWPDNARAGTALLLAPDDAFRADLTQALDDEWFRLYRAWNANFIWPSHFCSDMMCFTLLLMPTIALGRPDDFQYNRAHTLFWVVRSTQLSRMRRAEQLAGAAADGEPEGEIPVFHCKQLEPTSDRQPLTTRTARLTRASGEALARKHGQDVSEGSGVWWRLGTEVLPKQLGALASLYSQMPKSGPLKLRLISQGETVR